MPTITMDTIRRLAGFRGGGAPVVSCYLDVDGRRHVRRQDVVNELDQLMRGVRNGDARHDSATDLQRVERYVRHDLDRSHARGLAIFSCAARDLFEVIPLPVPVASRVVINNAPAVGQLEAIVEQLERLGVLLVDQQRARMLVFQFGELVDRSELFEEKPRQYDTLGERDQAGYDKAEHHVDELVQQHLRHAADVAFGLYQQDGFERLAVGAPGELQSTLEGLLHPYLRARLCRSIPVSVNASLPEVRAAAIALEAEVEREKEAALVTRLREAVGQGSRGVAGLEATLRALVERRVDVLFVSQGYRETGWRCGRCGYLCHKGPACPVDGTPMERVEDIVEEALDEAIGQSCTIEICDGNADLDVLGRIGALLRY